MAGKREKNRLRLPNAVMLLAAVGILLTMGAAPDAVSHAAPESAAMTMEPEQPAVEFTATVIAEEPFGPLRPPFGPVEERAAVEDAYFETAAFLGNSRTEGFKLYSGLTFGTYYYAMGATVETVFTKNVPTPAGEMPLLDALGETEPENIYVMLGVNELGWKGTDFFRENYSKVIDRLKADHPQAEILIQSILPVSEEQNAEKGYVNNARIAEYNAVVYALAEEKNCHYLDVAAAVADEGGFLPKEWTYDGVHLNKAGSRVWLDYLKTHTVP